MLAFYLSFALLIVGAHCARPIDTLLVDSTVLFTFSSTQNASTSSAPQDDPANFLGTRQLTAQLILDPTNGGIQVVQSLISGAAFVCSTGSGARGFCIIDYTGIGGVDLLSCGCGCFSVYGSADFDMDIQITVTSGATSAVTNAVLPGSNQFTPAQICVDFEGPTSVYSSVDSISISTTSSAEQTDLRIDQLCCVPPTIGTHTITPGPYFIGECSNVTVTIDNPIRLPADSETFVFQFPLFGLGTISPGSLSCTNGIPSLLQSGEPFAAGTLAVNESTTCSFTICWTTEGTANYSGVITNSDLGNTYLTNENDPRFPLDENNPLDICNDPTPSFVRVELLIIPTTEPPTTEPPTTEPPTTVVPTTEPPTTEPPTTLVPTTQPPTTEPPTTEPPTTEPPTTEPPTTEPPTTEPPTTEPPTTEPPTTEPPTTEPPTTEPPTTEPPTTEPPTTIAPTAPKTCESPTLCPTCPPAQCIPLPPVCPPPPIDDSNCEIYNTFDPGADISVNASIGCLFVFGGGVRDVDGTSGDDCIIIGFDVGVRFINTGNGNDEVIMLEDSSAVRIDLNGGNDIVDVRGPNAAIFNEIDFGGNGAASNDVYCFDSFINRIDGGRASENVLLISCDMFSYDLDRNGDCIFAVDGNIAFSTLGPGDDHLEYIAMSTNDIFGGPGNDVISVHDTSLVDEEILAGPGDDCVFISHSDIDAAISTEEGADVLHLENVALLARRPLLTGFDDDCVNVESVIAPRTLLLTNEGDDHVYMHDSTFRGVLLGLNDDTFYGQDTFLSVGVFGEAGTDNVVVDYVHTSQVNGGPDDDCVQATNALPGEVQILSGSTEIDTCIYDFSVFTFRCEILCPLFN